MLNKLPLYIKSIYSACSTLSMTEAAATTTAADNEYTAYIWLCRWPGSCEASSGSRLINIS